jgi:hypothetical protein
MKERENQNVIPEAGSLPMRSIKPFQSMKLTQFQAKPHFQFRMNLIPVALATHFHSHSE